MKILLILLILLCGCQPITYYPKGDKIGPSGREIQYHNSWHPYKCYKCKGDAYLYKVDSKERIICDTCYRKLK